ncbi:ferritin family protein, partial [Calditrichota bacterium]
MYNIDEVFEMAEQIERDGADFYRKAAAHVDVEEGKTLLLELASMEDDHEVVFAKLREKIAV